MKLKNAVILFIMVSFLALSGCAGPAEDSAKESAVDESAVDETVVEDAQQSGDVAADKLSVLTERLHAEGYGVIYVEEIDTYDTRSGLSNVIMHVATRENARYDIVDMAAIAYEYYPGKDIYTTQCDSKISGTSASSVLRPSYYVEKGAIVAYINGAMDKDAVKVR